MTKIRSYNTWKKEDDVRLVNLMWEGLIAEGIAEKLGVGLAAVTGRMNWLGIRLKDARQAKREGQSAEFYLDNCPVYKRRKEQALNIKAVLEKKEEKVKAAETVGEGFFSLLFLPQDEVRTPGFYIAAAKRLEKGAAELRNKAAKLLEEGISSGANKVA